MNGRGARGNGGVNERREEKGREGRWEEKEKKGRRYQLGCHK